MTEQSGIDILCDAAGSDLLLSTVFPVGSTPASNEERPVKRSKPSNDNHAGSPTSNHVCHKCKRVYERADHLTRHMRSHENARPYQCTRCPKRFNRADLLTRHETTHDRDADGTGRTLIRRSDRAAEACLNCAASKAKCDDQKPCGRCRSKNLPCQTSTRSPQQYRTASDAQSFSSQTVTPTMSSNMRGANDGASIPNGYAIAHRGNTVNEHAHGSMAEGIYADNMFQSPVLFEGSFDINGYFQPVHNFFQDLEFSSWDLNFDAFTIPQMEAEDPSPRSTTTNQSKPRALARDPSQGHAAFRRSPWLWEPDQKDCVEREKDGLHVNEESLANDLAFGRFLDKVKSKQLIINSSTRDRLFAMVVAENKDPIRLPSFPSLELLNYLLQAHMVHEDHQRDSWIHTPTFQPDETLPELVGSIIASGATFISTPAIWQFGFAMQEVLRVRVGKLFEVKNNNTRNLLCLQSYLIQLDMGVWSGFKRKTELAESFLLPIMTMVRRAGAFAGPPDSLAIIPTTLDSPDVLAAKWQSFVNRESYKRLVLHMFFHDVQTSLSLQKNALMSFTEINFSLPAARDLWKAPSAEAWRDIYLRKRHLPPDFELPRMQYVLHHIGVVDELEDHVDLELCYTAVLHAFWGQISAHREAIKFYEVGGAGEKNSSHKIWLKNQHKELYRDLSEFSTMIYTSRRSIARLAIVAELFMMTLHVTIDDLQTFAGKAGVEEARLLSTRLEEWSNSSEARYAVWHAGQVLHNARRLPPTSLRRFNAVAVYFASLTLWIYGLLSSNPEGAGNMSEHGMNSVDSPQVGSVSMSMGSATPLEHHMLHHQQQGLLNASVHAAIGAPGLVLLDGIETHETRAFLQLNRGIPGITFNGDPAAGVFPLSEPGAILSIAGAIYRENFPVRNEPLPTLVESLSNLLRDLGSVAGRSSAASEILA